MPRNTSNTQASSRRQFVHRSLSGLGLLAFGPASLLEGRKGPAPIKVVCVGGHPDDPESGCGGTLARFIQTGHTVTIVYLTTGEAGIKGKSHGEAAAIRRQEAVQACKVLGATPRFAGQIDGDTLLNNEWVSRMQSILEEEKPDLVFTHWPLDSHKDHQIASLLVIQAWMRTAHPFELLYFEVCTGEQTAIFRPTDYVDISSTQELKRQSVYCHQSQDPPGIYQCGHASMEEFRGREMGVKAAEAFVRMSGRGQGGIAFRG